MQQHPMQVWKDEFSGIRACARHIWQTEGVLAFFKGLLRSLFVQP